MSRQKQTEPIPAEKLIVIEHGKTREIVKAWQYYSIVNITRQFGMGAAEAADVAKWARTASPGDFWHNALVTIAVITV